MIETQSYRMDDPECQSRSRLEFGKRPPGVRGNLTPEAHKIMDTKHNLSNPSAFSNYPNLELP